MAYETFIPTVWNANLMRELEGKYVLAKHTYRAFEGQVTEQGDSVRFFGVGRPTIHETTVPAGKNTLHGNLPDPEEIENTTITMPIQQIRYYNYTVGDIDKLQMKWDGRVISAYQQETADGLASEVDKYLGQTVFRKRLFSRTVLLLVLKSLLLPLVIVSRPTPKNRTFWSFWTISLKKRVKTISVTKPNYMSLYRQRSKKSCGRD